MARTHQPDLPDVWRAVVTYTWPSGKTLSHYCGPFAAKGHATAAARREENSYAGKSATTITIQRSPLVWHDVSTTTKDET